MIPIKNTNAAIKNNDFILEFCPSGNSYGKRVTIICKDAKKTLKKYKDYYLFGSPIQYVENYGFLALRKNLKPKTRSGKKLVISNAMYHILKSSEDGSLQFEL